MPAARLPSASFSFSSSEDADFLDGDSVAFLSSAALGGNSIGLRNVASLYGNFIVNISIAIVNLLPRTTDLCRKKGLFC